MVLYSSDAAGLDWTFRSNVAVAEEFPWSGEGPNEATIALLPGSKTLICIIRVDAGDGGTGGKPFIKTFSSDHGRTWSAPQNMSSGIGTAKPRLLLMDGVHGPLVLVGGRPGNKVWVNEDGVGGEDWTEYAMPAPPNATVAATGAGRATTSYNGVARLTGTTGAVSYDYNGRTYAAPFTLTHTNTTRLSPLLYSDVDGLGKETGGRSEATSTVGPLALGPWALDALRYSPFRGAVGRWCALTVSRRLCWR